MIVVMKKGAPQEEVAHMVERVESMGLKAHVIVGTERTVIAAIGEKRDSTKESLASGAGVEDVVPILAPYKVASREVKPERTVIQAGSLVVGSDQLGVIAGQTSKGLSSVTASTSWIRKLSSMVRRIRMLCSGSPGPISPRKAF